YQIEKVPTSNGAEFKAHVNTPKITEDINKGKAKLEGMLTKQPKTSSPAPAPTPIPPPLTTPAHETIVPVTKQDGTFVMPEIPEIPVSPGEPQELRPLPSVPPPLPPR